MKIHRFMHLILFFFTASLLISEETPINLRYFHREGEVTHTDSQVNETIYVNGSFNHQAEIDEFSVSTIRQVNEDGGAVLDASFRTIEKVEGYPGILDWVSSETVRLERDIRGHLDVPDEAFRPVQRHVPRFPEFPVKPGDTWSLPAEEVHVFRIGGQIFGPYKGQAQVLYTYSSKEMAEKHSYARIGIEYSIYLPVRGDEPIRLLSGQSHQELLWDIELGRPLSKTEKFEFLMLMADGRTQEFTGEGKTNYRITRSMDRESTVESLRSELESVPGIKVHPADEGIKVSVEELDSILFEPESSVISEDQKYRLDELARILSEYMERDILITGHTAGYGTVEGRQKLSFERAHAVGKSLFPRGRPGPGKLFLRGAGNTEPMGSDRADRRVEILIMD